MHEFWEYIELLSKRFSWLGINFQEHNLLDMLIVLKISLQSIYAEERFAKKED